MSKLKKSFKDFYQYYILVVTVIILTLFIQTVIQYSLNEQQRMASLINVAGKQRMLSQQVLANFYAYRQFDGSYSDLKVPLDGLYRTNNALQVGDYKLGLEPLEDAEVQALFAKLEVDLNFLYSNLSNMEKLNEIDMYVVKQTTDKLVKEMDDIVYQFQKVAEDEVTTLMMVELELAFLSILIVVLEVFFIIKPAIKKIKSQNKKLKEISWHQTHAFNSHIKNIKDLHHILNIEKKIEHKEELVTCVMEELHSLEEVSSNMVKTLETTNA